MIGDYKSLYPIVESDSNNILNESLFDKLC